MNILQIVVKYWKILVGVVFIGLLLTIGSQYNTIKKKDVQISNTITNIKAYSQENSILKDRNQVFKLSVEQLEYYNDSLNDQLDADRKLLKIKDKDLKSMQYYKEMFNKRDTIRFRDTIFAKGVDIDTTLVDKYYTLKLRLKYPDTLVVNPSFINEKEVFVHSRKETINPPCKFFV